MPLVGSRIWTREWLRSNLTLLLIYAVSATGSGSTDIQAGGNVNYFFECFFAMTPFAVLGALRLFSLSNRRIWVAFFMGGMFLLDFLPSSLRSLTEDWAIYKGGKVEENNRKFLNLKNALNGLRILSIDPRMALIDPHPPLVEPYLLSYLRRLGHFDASPLIKRIYSTDFDVLVSPPVSPQTWRGVPHFEGADLDTAVSDSYEPDCMILGDVIKLPRSRADNAVIKEKLRAGGCAPNQAP